MGGAEPPQPPADAAPAPLTGPPPLVAWAGQRRDMHAGPLVFHSDFDGGNLARVEMVMADPHRPPSPSVYGAAAVAAAGGGDSGSSAGEEDPPPPPPPPAGGAEPAPATPPPTAPAEPPEAEQQAQQPAAEQPAQKPVQKPAADPTAAAGAATSPSTAAAEPEPDLEEVYQLWIAPDCAGMPCETRNRSWFHWRVGGGRAGQAVTFRVMNSNPHQKLFDLDMRPVWRVPPLPSTGWGQRPPEDAAATEWARVPHKVTHMACRGYGVINIPFTFPGERPVEIAFTYPYPAEMLWRRIGEWEAQAQKVRSASLSSLLDDIDRGDPAARASRPAHAAAESPQKVGWGCRPPPASPPTAPPPALGDTEAAAAAATALAARSRDRGVYFFREQPLRTPDGLPVDLITVSSMGGLTGEEPDAAGFGDKQYCLISARVHPGEIPASWILDGLMDFLVSDDEAARALRRRWVFKVIPMLNPDGVRRGHSRADIFGRNLNRHYDAPTREEHPSVWAAKDVFLSLHKTGRLGFYVDLHAHHSKRGCFFYGNHLGDPVAQADTQLFPLLLSKLCPHFDYKACNFSAENMSSKDARDESKEGSARVAAYRATGFTKAFTLEVNYNTSNITTCPLAAAAAADDGDDAGGDAAGARSPPAGPAANSAGSAGGYMGGHARRGRRSSQPPAAVRYDPPLLRGIGRALALAVLHSGGGDADAPPPAGVEIAKLREQLRQEIARAKPAPKRRAKPRGEFMKAARGAQARSGVLIL